MTTNSPRASFSREQASRDISQISVRGRWSGVRVRSRTSRPTAWIVRDAYGLAASVEQTEQVEAALRQFELDRHHRMIPGPEDDSSARQATWATSDAGAEVRPSP